MLARAIVKIGSFILSCSFSLLLANKRETYKKYPRILDAPSQHTPCFQASVRLIFVGSQYLFIHAPSETLVVLQTSPSTHLGGILEEKKKKIEKLNQYNTPDITRLSCFSGRQETSDAQLSARLVVQSRKQTVTYSFEQCGRSGPEVQIEGRHERE